MQAPVLKTFEPGNARRNPWNTRGSAWWLARALQTFAQRNSSRLGVAVKFPPQGSGDGAGLAGADWMAVDRYHGQHDLARRRDKGLARRVGLLEREGAFLERKPTRLDGIEQHHAGDAAQDGVIGGRARDHRAGLCDDPGVG